MVDEWIYIDAAQHFAQTRQLDIAPISLAPSIFEAIYGGIVLWIFSGFLLTPLIMSTAVLGAAAALALWYLITQSGVQSRLATLIVGAFLFGAVFYSLSATYMTDGHALSLALISAALYSKGIDDGKPHSLWLLAGSAVAAAAYLSRPGALGVVAGVSLVATRRRQWSCLPWALALPFMTVGVHLVGQSVGLLPAIRSDILDRFNIPTWQTLSDVVIVAAISIGIWLLPLLPLMWHATVRSRDLTQARHAVAISSGLLLTGLLLSGSLPAIGSWLNRTGMFPIDGATLGSRHYLLGWPVYVLVAILAILVAAFAFTGVSRSRNTVNLRSAEVGLWSAAALSLLLVLFTQVAIWGRIPDRYLIILLPAVLFSVATRWLTETPVGFQRWSWATLGIAAALSIVMAVDGMRLQDAVFTTADSAISQGIDLSEVDGGAAWTGFVFGLNLKSEDARPIIGPPWWRGIFAPGIDPRYEVTINPSGKECILHPIEVTTILGSDNRVGLVDSAC